MALDKLVDSVQLDSDLTSVANAIRTKGGTSASLSFPQGFVDAVGTIQTGGGGADGFLARYVSTDPFISDVTITSDGLKFGTEFAARSIVLKNATGSTWYGQQYWLWKNNKVQYVVLPKIERASEDMCADSTGLLGVDFKNIIYLHNKAFKGCSNLATIVLRKSSIVNLYHIGALNNGTPFASGGTGGTIYIPKALYDHLGDGSSLDYKSASNWSTLDGYGTITWAAIEGSPYETAYVDGTPIT